MPGIPTPRKVAASVNNRRTRTVEDSRMPLTEHLRELRNRLAKALLAFVAAFVVCFIFRETILGWLTAPYCKLPADIRVKFDEGQGCRLYVFGVIDAFMINLKVSAIAAAVVSAPVWLYQLWSFITPGLHRHERRWSLTFVVCSLALFVIGGFFAYITLETGLRLLLGFAGDELISALDANKYLSYALAMLVIFGLSFEVPLLVCMLNLAGVVTTKRLRSWRRAEIFLTFVFAAIVTPSQDPFTMLALGLPMVLLYEVALLVGWFNDRRKRLRGDDSVYSDLDDDDASPLDFDDSGESQRRAALEVRARQDGRAGRKARKQLAALAQAEPARATADSGPGDVT
ncbi:twin-arginine translocase subunit TatC [Frankia sp. CNm7]|uniref:Sec-independent protein translocase protein TatC n=1 Tax=Frankia nepalensis TaxID=1836974 RepID=A0A937URD3_9ACTN|nr:twin-arginine translocase subunit TatC [Frankia nepalensis]MBL7502556.1 twin-arginine translocase subunit TatC [Frankia nepalensis]MBL7511744.1 twin-arginine translocase subunit TatC [Frankia nepalensis]MBL7520066.1 twin-arginine translocase subunit TatC [Frankia nepalensis]MBL7629130.1 twin-arginine translocase subunit TatC [Frankia nepalensis]